MLRLTLFSTTILTRSIQVDCCSIETYDNLYSLFYLELGATFKIDVFFLRTPIKAFFNLFR